ncbi:alpha/beta hydrolase fold domain-containing protein [Streptomyces humi]
MSLKMRLAAAYLGATRTRRAALAPEESPRPPDRLARRHQISLRNVGGFDCHTVTPRTRPAERAVFYVHGGSYVSPVTPYHWNLVSRLVDAGVRVDIPHYGLAPRYTYRDAYPFLIAVYRNLLADIGPGGTAIAGDSAGGGLALGLTQRLVDCGLPQPSRLVLIAPWVDLTMANPAIRDIEARDPMLTRTDLLDAGRAWADGDDLALPLLSPVNGPLAPLPPTDVYIGTRDLFHPDNLRLADRAAAAGTRINVTECKGAIHVYPLVPAPEGRAAARTIVESLSR